MKKTLLLLLSLILFEAHAQTQIQGKVIDDQSSPLPGVSVLVKGTNTGTTTDASGNYELTVPAGATQLAFSFIGYATVTKDINGQTTINVSLDQESNQLQEVVVNALGFKTQKDRSGSTSSTVTSQAIKTTGEVGILNSLAGKASGVKIARANGDPGAGTSIQIRGANTIGGSSQPLVIVDGVPISNDNLYGSGSSRAGGVSQQSRLNDLNPEDVESVQVLKGASAAALWGSRAANGVLVITTKQGKLNQRMKISYSASYSLDEINRKHPLQTTWGQGTGGKYNATSANSWGDKISARAGGEDAVTTSGEYFLGQNGEKVYPIRTKNSQQTFVDDNFNDVFRTGSFLDHNLTISGGGGKTTNYFSLGYLGQDGIIKNSDYTRFTMRFNNQTFFNNYVNLTTKANYVFSDANRIQQNSNTAGLYLGLLRTPPDFDQNPYIGTHFSATGVATTDRQRSYRRYLGNNVNPTYNNPLWTVNEQEGTTKVNRFNANSNLNINPVSWLQLDLRGGIDTYVDKRVYFAPVGSASFTNGRLDNEDITNTEINVDAIARADFPNLIPDKVGLNVTAGFNINDRNRGSLYASTNNFLVNSRLPTFANGVAPFDIRNNTTRIRSNRGYGILSFDIFKQIFLNVSGTQEAASTISGTFFYPSADLAWQFSDLIKNQNDIFSFGKLRLSYGQVGVQPLPYKFGTTYETFTYGTYDDALDINEFGGGFRLNDDQGNANLKPEIKTEFEIGTDLRFFRDRLTLGATYYKNEINDILLAVNLSPSSGFLSKYANAGRMENRGLEIDFNLATLKKDNFSLDFYGNFNNNRNKVLDLAGVDRVALTDQSITSNAIVGQPLGILFGSRAARKPDGSLDLDENGFPKLAPEQGIIGDPNPDWRGGLGLRGAFKGLSFNVLFETYQGGDFAERTRFVLNSFGTYNDTENEVTLTKDLKNAAGTIFPAGTTVRGNIGNYGAGDILLDEQWYTTLGGGLGGSAINEFSITDGSWTRLREISLGYSIGGAKFRNATKLGSIDLSVSGRNLKLWTKVKGIDPEVNQSGVDNGFGIEYFTNPSTRSWVFTVKINY
ncbi:SusC/RagA family TonB-linked outer membrane protein [Persicitalea jodogahamensis]|uniref:SusC/RagA family TonB-linked outer membrane protein n=1 Tax=Persicitalea jodogahamensis TaxID=402147 RepID=A0A8J3D3E2_9BACT|nr:SusC/RagA family TonB-linked outer membrane protein [Persicitalea jodogahamensis]GHB64528.1 SusC/RagA family TonB-linked outer membrane protein [Persicitalea jodogahamensis]